MRDQGVGYGLCRGAMVGAAMAAAIGQCAFYDTRPRRLGVVERVGMAGFNKIFSSPLTLPRLDELGDPDAWVARVHGPLAPAP